MKFSPEGYPTMFIIGVLSIVLILIAWQFLPKWASWTVSIPIVIIFFIVVYFFRDPERIIPPGENLLLSPADGKVVLVKQIQEDVYLKSAATQISIFLSPLNVHVNRVPASGVIEYVKYHPGKFLMAWEEDASELNERADFGLRHTSGIPVFFKQITGFLARRIVYHLAEGDSVTAGDRFGIMKFGSRMDVIVPEGIEISVKAGDNVVAGNTILGRIPIER